MLEPHPNDRKWIKEQLSKLPPAYQQKAQAGYIEAFKGAHDAEPVDHKKMNAARETANTKLRLFVDKVTKRY